MVSNNDSKGYQGNGLPKFDNKPLLILAFLLKNGYPSVLTLLN